MPISARALAGAKTSGMLKRIAPVRKGQHALRFREGGLHAATGTTPGAKIPAAKHAAARAGRLGPKAKRQEVFFENVLRKGRRRGR